MQVKVTKKNVNQEELTKALSGYILNEHLEDEVITLLKNKDRHKEIIPEKYIRSISRKLNVEFKSLRILLNRNVDKWLNSTTKGKFWLRPKKDFPILTQEQIDELKDIIEAHFKYALGLSVSKSTEKTWIKLKLNKPKEDLSEWITQSYVAGRLAEVLDNKSTYNEMLKLASKVPLTRQDELILQAAKNNAAKYIKGYGEKLANIAEDVALKQHQQAINYLVQQYFSGDLKQTKYNSEGLNHNEVESLFETDSPVKNIRQFAMELKARFKSEDAGRDWDRVAESEIRYSTNLGRLMSIQYEGGGNPNEIEVYYHVQPTACKYCKELYLESDGTPKIFKLSEILDNIQETGGMNMGRKSSLIGKPGGWIPNSLAHPNCHCFPIIYQEGYEMIIPKGDKDHD